MASYQASPVWKELPTRETSGIRRWFARIPSSTQHILLSIIGSVISIVVPAVLALNGVGMSRQSAAVALDTATASLFAITCGFIVIIRLLNFPLLRTTPYVASTFVSTFALVATSLKFFRIDFSSPQFFFGMVMIAMLIEGFLWAQRRLKPRHIVVVPGGLSLAKLPTTLFRPIKITMLAAVPNKDFNFNGVVADLSCNLGPEWEHFLAVAALRGIPVYHVKQFNESITGRVAVDHLWENTLGGVVPALIYPQFKRAIDIVIGVVVAPFIALIIGVCAILIRLESPGPILYRQQRTGLGGKSFTILKLRTMTHGQGGDAYTRDADPRITRIGRWLRQYRIDELPQIVNILRGDMSWIGPRPEALALAQWYESEIPFYAYRHIVRPGVSGWAQVNQGNVAAIDAAREKLEYDFFYIKHFSIWLDAVVVLKTMRTVLTRFGSR